MQKQNALITDTRDSLQQCLEKLDEFAQEDIDLPFENAQDEDGKLMILPKTTNLPATQQFKQTNQLSENQKKKKKPAEKCLTIHREKFEISNEYQGKQAVNRIKETLLLSVKSTIRDRLASLEDAEYNAMNFIDHSRWNYDDSTYAIDDIKMLANHFSTMLIHADFKLDAAIFEFGQLKKLVKSRYQHFSHSTSLWKTIASKHHYQYPHILLLVELILSVEWALSTVERGFSTVNRMLPNSRLSLPKNRLNMVLLQKTYLFRH